MNPMLPQARTPPMPQTTMVAPNQAPTQAAPPVPQIPNAPPVPPVPSGSPPSPSIVPQQMPDIVQMMIQRMLANSPPGQAAPGGLQSAPVRGTTPTVGGM
jgi:hypothetical protein